MYSKQSTKSHQISALNIFAILFVSNLYWKIYYSLQVVTVQVGNKFKSKLWNSTNRINNKIMDPIVELEELGRLRHVPSILNVQVKH